MPYNSTLPVNGSLILAEELRGNSNELKALIDALTAQNAALQTQLTDALGRITVLESAGYVTQGDIDNAINGTANNINAVSDLGGLTVSDPVTQGEGQAIADKLSEVINSLHR